MYLQFPEHQYETQIPGISEHLTCLLSKITVLMIKQKRNKRHRQRPRAYKYKRCL